MEGGRVRETCPCVCHAFRANLRPPVTLFGRILDHALRGKEAEGRRQREGGRVRERKRESEGRMEGGRVRKGWKGESTRCGMSHA